MKIQIKSKYMEKDYADAMLAPEQEKLSGIKWSLYGDHSVSSPRTDISP